ncbi:MAG: GIY-YIG nuclease family protein [Rickettsiales bacterium]
MLTDKPSGVLYIGVTSNFIQRIHQHKTDAVDGFTKRYHVHRLVWYEFHETAESAILREKRLKKWNRAMKIDLIEQTNPRWEDLYPSIVR